MQVKGLEEYIPNFFFFNNTEKISIEWESERDDIFPFQVSTITLSMQRQKK